MADSALTDPEILMALQEGITTNRDLRVHFFPGEAHEYQPTLDRALQRLRKAGTIRCVRGYWETTATKTCMTCGGTGKVPA